MIAPGGNISDSQGGVTVIYDLSEPKVWDAALLARKGWGRRYSYVEVLDSDHIAIAFMPGGARELPA